MSDNRDKQRREQARRAKTQETEHVDMFLDMFEADRRKREKREQDRRAAARAKDRK